jgi:ubiquinone/menaquinone biosynthesis C-methylase UbiE
MRKLPYKDKSFDIILCMWSAFIELHKKQDQIKALKEMLRIIKKDGFALLEMPKPRRTKKKVVVSEIDGVTATPMFVQNKTTLKDLMKKVYVKKYKIFVDNFGGRERLFLQFWK